MKPPTLYHATTPKKLARYNEHHRIITPVRGFDSLAAAQEWARQVGRTVIVRVDALDVDHVHKLPDHHNEHGTAWWYDRDATDYEVIK